MLNGLLALQLTKQTIVDPSCNQSYTHLNCLASHEIENYKIIIELEQIPMHDAYY